VTQGPYIQLPIKRGFLKEKGKEYCYWGKKRRGGKVCDFLAGVRKMCHVLGFSWGKKNFPYLITWGRGGGE